MSSLVALAQPWLAGLLTQTLLDGSNTIWSVSEILILWLALVVMRSGIGFGTQYYIGSTGELMTSELRSRLFQHAQSLPIGYYRQRRSGDVLALLSNDTAAISSFVTDTLVQILPLLITFTGAFVMMTFLDPLLAVLAAVLIPAYYATMKIVGRKLRPISRAWIDAYSNLMAFLNEHLTMLQAIKSFAREPVEKQNFTDYNTQLLNLSKKQLMVEALLAPIVGLMTSLGLILLLWLGTSRIADGTRKPSTVRDASDTTLAEPC